MIPANFNHLYYFYRVATLGNFSAAARELRIAQSALSTQIQNFEAYFNTRLFNRTNKGISLTESGELFYKYAQKLFGTFQDFLNEYQDTSMETKGRLKVASVNSIGIYWLPQILKKFATQCPGVQLKVDFKSSNAVIEQLALGKVDVAFVAGRPGNYDFVCQKLFENNLALVVHASHPLAGQKVVTKEQLGSLSFIGYELGTPTRDLVDQYLLKNGIRPNYVIESSNIETIRRMVDVGLGASFLPEFVLQHENLANAGLVTLGTPGGSITQDVLMYYRQGHYVTKAMRKFLAVIQESTGVGLPQGHAA